MCPHDSSEGEGLKKKVSPFIGDLEGLLQGNHI